MRTINNIYRWVCLSLTLLVLTAHTTPAYADYSMAPNVNWGVNIEESERQVSSLPTVVVYRKNGYLNTPRPIRNTARSGGRSLVDLLLDTREDCHTGRKYWCFADAVTHQEMIGSGGQSIGQMPIFPHGLYIVVYINPTELHGVRAMAGSIDGGQTFMPAVLMPAGWAVVFSPEMMPAGQIAHVTIAYVDKSGQKKVRFLFFKLGDKRVTNTNWGHFQFKTHQLVDSSDEPIDIDAYSYDELYAQCRGLLASKVVAPRPANGSRRSSAPLSSHSSKDRPSLRGGLQTVSVSIEDKNGREIEESARITILSIADGRVADTSSFMVSGGANTLRVKPGEGYTAIAQDGDLTLIASPDDEAITIEGDELPIRQPDGDGKVRFTFRLTKGGKTNFPGRQVKDRDSHGDTVVLTVKFKNRSNTLAQTNVPGRLICVRNGQKEFDRPIDINQGYFRTRVPVGCRYIVTIDSGHGVNAGDWVAEDSSGVMDYVLEDGRRVRNVPYWRADHGNSETTIKFVRR